MSDTPFLDDLIEALEEARLAEAYKSDLRKREAEVETLTNHNEELWKSLRLAKAQRDRAIARVVFMQGPWHPDQEGRYNLER